MKPGDHPEFYRLAPPEGRSRESAIVLDGNGNFWNGGEKFEHTGMIRAFASWVRRHPDDGRYILSNDYDWTYLTVDDAPCFVRAAEVRGKKLWLTLLGGQEQPMPPEGLMVGAGDALYVDVEVHGERLLAKFMKAAQAALVEVITEGAQGEPVVELSGERYPIRARS
jgi:uncharacterized protein